MMKVCSEMVSFTRSPMDRNPATDPSSASTVFHLPGEVPFGEDAHRLAAIHHQKGADVMLGQQGQGLEDGVVGVDRNEPVGLGAEELLQ